MRRRLPLVPLLACLLLAGCHEEEQSVGPGPGPATPRAAAGAGAPEEIERRLSRATAGAAQASAYADEGPLPGGALFDGSGRFPRGASAVPVSYSPGRGGAAAGPAYRLSRGRSYSARGDVPPSPGSLPAVRFPDAQPGAGARGGGPVLQAFDSFQRATYADAVQVLSRLAWGARPAREASVAQHPTHVTVHHTDGHPRTALTDSIEEIRGIQAFHQGPERRWADIGYHFVLDGAGRVFEGRHADVLGAHAGGANLDNVGIAVMGDYNRDQLSQAQKTSLKRLITFLALRYRIDPAKGFIHRHLDFSNTDCPGAHIVEFLKTLPADVAAETRTLASGGTPDDAAAGFVPLAMVR